MGMIKGFMWGIFDIWSFVQNMIWPTTVVIVVIIICRLFVKKISKQASYFLWLIVAIRLICPVTIESELSIFNLTERLDTGSVSKPEQESDFLNNESSTTIFEETNSTTNVRPSQSSQEAIHYEELSGIEVSNEQMLNADTKHDLNSVTILMSDNAKCTIWFAGVAVMFLYGILSYGQLKHKLRFATRNKNGFFESETITSPFVLGIVRPVIYLPCHLSEEEQNYILLHEKYHIKRRDYLVKIVAFTLLCVYWFHPLVWTAFYLMGQDMETSCDEQVLKNLTIVERKSYSTLLLNFATRKKIPMPTPLSFGENNVKSRIKQILNYKKPTRRALVLVAGLILLVGMICLTDPSKEAVEDNTKQDISEILDEDNKADPETGRLTDEYLSQLSEKLYEAKNPYIGNAPANGKIINYLKDALDITGTNGMELQTSQEPYWLTLQFDKKPDDEKMFHLATLFLVLVDNAFEFRWEFPHEITGDACVYYVNTTLVHKLLADNPDYNIKKLADSPESIAKLWRSLEVIREQYETTTGRSGLVGESNWEYFAQKFGFDFAEANKWENRFVEDDLIYMESDDTPFHVAEVTSCIYEDFDENGVMDMAVLITCFSGEAYGSGLFFYMDDAEHYTLGSTFMSRCLGMDIQTGDIDHDGYKEFVFIGGSTGNGGAGSFCKAIFKYKEESFWDMPYPGDYTEINEQFPACMEMGYHLEAYWGEELDTYDIYCPALNVTKTIYSPYLRNEKGELFHTPKPGEAAGDNCRGFHTLNITEINGKDYLVGTELVTGDGGTSHCLANARFVMEWDDDNGWIVKDFYVMPIDDIYKMAAVIWEYGENTYVLYGKTAAGDCSSVVKVASYIIGYLE